LSGKNARIPLQDYKSLCVAVMICATLVNTHTHTDADTDSFCASILLAQTAELNMDKVIASRNSFAFINPKDSTQQPK